MYKEVGSGRGHLQCLWESDLRDGLPPRAKKHFKKSLPAHLKFAICRTGGNHFIDHVLEKIRFQYVTNIENPFVTQASFMRLPHHIYWRQLRFWTGYWVVSHRCWHLSSCIFCWRQSPMCWSPICSAPPMASTHRAGSAGLRGARRSEIWIPACTADRGDPGDQGWISYNGCLIAATWKQPKGYSDAVKLNIAVIPSLFAEGKFISLVIDAPDLFRRHPFPSSLQMWNLISFLKPFIWFYSCGPGPVTIHTYLQDWPRTDKSGELW